MASRALNARAGENGESEGGNRSPRRQAIGAFLAARAFSTGLGCTLPFRTLTPWPVAAQNLAVLCGSRPRDIAFRDLADAYPPVLLSALSVPPCNSCGSENQGKFTGEIAIHSPGPRNIDKPVVWVFPQLVVCLDCGIAQFAVPSSELRLLEKDSAAGAG